MDEDGGRERDNNGKGEAEEKSRDGGEMGKGERYGKRKAGEEESRDRESGRGRQKSRYREEEAGKGKERQRTALICDEREREINTVTSPLKATMQGPN